MLLAIDTATSLIGAAVHDGRSVLSSVTREDARRHGELLAPAVQEALDEVLGRVAAPTRIATYGDTPAAMQVLVEVLIGQAPAPGGVFTVGRWRETEWGPVLTDAVRGNV